LLHNLSSIGEREMSGRVLITDDDRAMCEMLEADLGHRGFIVKWHTSAAESVETVKKEDFDVLLTDLQMPGLNGIELCRRIVSLRPDIPVIVITAFGSMDSAVSALRAGAYDFISKPVDTDNLTIVLERAIKHRELLEQVATLQQTVRELRGSEDIIGTSPAMQKVYDLMKRVSGLDTSILIVGESGTGKELIARSLHRNSPRSTGPFVAFNCAAVPETLLESELFGHSRGAFTDAKTSRDGLFARANGGTLLLDEVADMAEALQPKLLRAIEQRAVRPVGSDREIPFDVRIIASTNRDIESMVSDGKFREDLYFRLNVIQLNVPPLRARDNDILLLAQHFIGEFAASTSKEVAGISTPAAKKLLAYAWPGNVRELRNCIERAVALTGFDKITVEDLPERIQNFRESRIVVASGSESELLTMDEIESRYITHVLKSVRGNKTMASRILGLDRKTLYRRLERHSINAESLSNPDE